MRAGAERRGIEVDEEALAAGTKAVEEQIETESDAFVASGELWDDGIIDPRDTRTVLGIALSAVAQRASSKVARASASSGCSRGALVQQGPGRQPRRDRPADRSPAAASWASPRSRSTPMPTPPPRSSREADEAVPLAGDDRRRDLPRHRRRPRRGAAERAPTPSIPATASWPRTRRSRRAVERRRPGLDRPAARRRSRRWAPRSGPEADGGGRRADRCPAASSATTPTSRRPRGGDRLPAAGQGLGRRRRQGHAPRRRAPTSSPTPSTGARREAEAAFGDRTVFLERYLQRAAPHRGPGARRRARHGRAPRRARVLGPAAAPEGRRGGAVAAVDDARCASSSARPRSPPPRRSATSAPARSSSCSTSSGRVLLPRDEHAPAGRAPGHRDGHRHSTSSPSSSASPPGSRCPRPRRRSAIDGHAIEVRLYAEDAAAGFLPQTGTVERIRIPAPRRSRRLDGCAGRAARRLRRRGRHRRRPRLRPDARQADRLGARPRDGGGRARRRARRRRDRRPASPTATSSSACSAPSRSPPARR